MREREREPTELSLPPLRERLQGPFCIQQEPRPPPKAFPRFEKRAGDSSVCLFVPTQGHFERGGRCIVKGSESRMLLHFALNLHRGRAHTRVVSNWI